MDHQQEIAQILSESHSAFAHPAGKLAEPIKTSHPSTVQVRWPSNKNSLKVRDNNLTIPEWSITPT